VVTGNIETQGNPTMSQGTLNAVPSLHDAAVVEAARHKWIESEKQGNDLGEAALVEWYRLYWAFYCRFRRFEHLEGRRRWREFEESKFGQLCALIVAGDQLVDRVLDRYFAGMENLDIISWAIDWGLPSDRVIDILHQLDINLVRIEPRGISQ